MALIDYIHSHFSTVICQLSATNLASLLNFTELPVRLDTESGPSNASTVFSKCPRFLKLLPFLDADAISFFVAGISVHNSLILSMTSV